MRPRRVVPPALVAALAMLLALALPAAAQTGPVAETVIGVRNLMEASSFWTRFGYRVGEAGSLDELQADALYFHASTLSSLRLYHGDRRHGGIRLVVWGRPVRGNGQMDAPLLALGSRWTVHLTTDLLGLAAAAQVARAADPATAVAGPVWTPLATSPRDPFGEPVRGAWELLVLRPEARLVAFQRVGYQLGSFGRIAEESPLRTSEAVQAGVMVPAGAGDPEGFYGRALGLRLAERRNYGPAGFPAAGPFLGLTGGQALTELSFDSPVARGDGDLGGRFKVLVVPANLGAPDLREIAIPGALGLTHVAFRVRDVAGTRARLVAAGADPVSDVLPDEFGAPSVVFRAPDGTWGQLLEDPEP